MLINCPECNKEISNQSDKCIYCGFPLINDSKFNCIINGKEYNLSFLLNANVEYVDKLIEFVQLTDCYFGDSGDEIEKIINTKIIPKYLNIKTNKEYNEEQNIPKCPTCSSTNIEKIGVIERGASVTLWGLLSKKINKSFKCKDCGYTW